MYTLGIDVGSASSKAVILGDDKQVVASAVIQSGTGTSGPGRVSEKDMDYIVATGYGRFSVPFADKQMSEITCHAKGIHHLIPDARTIIDIGGQDAKAIRLDHKGNILKFVMNDKCAAGTGRFLDVMSRVLEIGLQEIQGRLSGKCQQYVYSLCRIRGYLTIIKGGVEGKYCSRCTQIHCQQSLLFGLQSGNRGKSCDVRGGCTG